MKKTLITFSATILMLAIGVVAAQPKTLDGLLAKVKQGTVKESAEYKRREKEFLKAKNKQQSILNKMVKARDNEERRSVDLENTFNKQEEDLAKLTDLLTKRLGSLRELFGILQQVSGDLRGKFETSNISGQFPNRGQWLADLAKRMGTATELATVEEIERVIYELQREMTESGKVVRFNAEVNGSDGDSETREVVRVGTFNLISNGSYLKYDTDTQSLVELPRQPESRYLSTADNLQSASSGYMGVALDPSRGSILAALVSAPSFKERVWDQGGKIGKIIIFVGLFGFSIAIMRWFAVGGIGRKVSRQIANESPSDDNPLGRVLSVYQKNKSVDTETLELKLGEAILKETPNIVKFVSLLKIIAVVAPLMGLLGTVTGMINTFQAITLFGAGDPKLMAGGISQALVTTMLGLWVAIPMTLLHSVVNTRSKGIIHVLEEQSAGIIAAHNERKG